MELRKQRMNEGSMGKRSTEIKNGRKKGKNERKRLREKKNPRETKKKGQKTLITKTGKKKENKYGMRKENRGRNAGDKPSLVAVIRIFSAFFANSELKPVNLYFHCYLFVFLGYFFI